MSGRIGTATAHNVVSSNERFQIVNSGSDFLLTNFPTCITRYIRYVPVHKKTFLNLSFLINRLKRNFVYFIGRYFLGVHDFIISMRILLNFRVYSPVVFGKKTDPEGNYIRKYLPQLAKYPSKYIYSPWEAPLSVQKAAGCIVGGYRNYRYLLLGERGGGLQYREVSVPDSKCRHI
jgi:hypothetical protein